MGAQRGCKKYSCSVFKLCICVVWKMERQGHQDHQLEELLTFEVGSLLKKFSCFIFVNEHLVNLLVWTCWCFFLTGYVFIFVIIFFRWIRFIKGEGWKTRVIVVTYRDEAAEIWNVVLPKKPSISSAWLSYSSLYILSQIFSHVNFLHPSLGRHFLRCVNSYRKNCFEMCQTHVLQV